ncbi:hypothetical protein MPER_10949 [Moniliophthora perniciosa FA553]|nr:hypothetical protein MPER_10949 [Moniliophthora perniciosa FA553]
MDPTPIFNAIADGAILPRLKNLEVSPGRSPVSPPLETIIRTVAARSGSLIPEGISHIQSVRIAVLGGAWDIMLRTKLEALCCRGVAITTFITQVDVDSEEHPTSFLDWCRLALLPLCELPCESRDVIEERYLLTDEIFTILEFHKEDHEFMGIQNGTLSAETGNLLQMMNNCIVAREDASGYPIIGCVQQRTMGLCRAWRALLSDEAWAETL